MKFKIPVIFECYSFVEVEADTLQEAADIVQSGEGFDDEPFDYNLISGSMQVDYGDLELIEQHVHPPTAYFIP